MKILRLELFGFKSFKDKTIVTFDQPITAIVGSNGCGKSNVVDALYWVMGDQSPKHLRGASMADVIFSGSRDTAPMDVAEVTMVLERDPENDPVLSPQFQGSNEIGITRRYYRSGESECFINKVPCRLRDIQEFFMDTGLGAKAYSIIEQGAITRMVAQKPEERRVVIEEVAGIMKFKARRAETERKIENSRLNLQRVDDILKDLQKQLTSLKRQADKAERFKALSAELRDLEIRVGAREWMTRSENKNQTVTEVTELQSKSAALEDEATRQRGELEAAREALAAAELLLEECRVKTRESELELKDVRSQKGAVEARRETLTQRRVSDEHQLEELASRAVELEEQLVSILTEIATLETEISAQGARLETLIEEAAALRNRSEELRAQAQEARASLHREELEHARLAQQIQGHQKEIAQTENRREALEAQLEGIAGDLRQKENERQTTLGFLETAFATRSDLEASKNAVDQELAGFETGRHELSQVRDEVKNELTTVRIRKEQLEALERDLDGVDSASKALALHFRDKGVLDSLLADRIHVPKLLEKAIEALLGRHLQRVVVDDFNSLGELSSVLGHSNDSAARQARASMWMPPMTSAYASVSHGADFDSLYLAADSEEESIEEVPGPDGMISQVHIRKTTKVVTAKEYLLNHPGVVGPLTKIVETEIGATQWLPLVSGFWVVRDREALSDLAPKLQGLPIDFVSLDGDVLTRDGLLDLAPAEAASGNANVGLVQRKREIQDLRIREGELTTKFEAAQADLDACLHGLSQAKEKFRDLTTRLSALNPDVETHSRFLSQVEAQLARMSEKTSLLQAELERLAAHKAEVSAKLEEASTQVIAVEERTEAARAARETADAELSVGLAAQQASERALSELQNSLKTLERRMSELQSKRAASEQEKILSIGRQDQLRQELDSLEAETSALQEEIIGFEGDITTREAALSDHRTAEAERAEAVQVQRTTQDTLQRQLDRKAREMQELLGRMKDLEQNLAVNDVELRNISERLEREYQIALEALDPEKLKEMASPGDIEEAANPESGATRAQQLRQKIDNMGNINMVASEEFNELSHRHEYLFIQRQDLADGISQLVEAVERIDRESRQRFSDAFHAVNKSFQATFPIMFGGGNAELRLTNPDNMLETGVEIVAQPPGKKLQSVMLLSGGEKALTAVSLIFGIFAIKPSPFCVLDEVDAPLDDANVGRFNTQVRIMSETSQIIMITHHKKTMESADALFGVTMEKPGISNVASARLGELR